MAGIVSRSFPSEFNPFAQLGAVANSMFAIALASGILLLFWYSPSVTGAYDSVAAMKSSPYLAELLRSLHRYSSDVCILFIILHAFQMLGARKFGGARWVAWLTGMLLLGLIWVDGWTGYWLVWDDRAGQIALGTANFLDVLPIFPDPLLRSFLTNDGLNSLFFFIIFFIHMLIPIGMAVFMWIHIMRINSAKFFTSVKMTSALFAVLVFTSLLFPATLAGKADMMSVPVGMNVDWLYMMPLWFTERLSGGLLWLVLFFATVGLWGIPWWLTKKRPDPALVNPASCNGCTQCFQDCPFNAIDMVASDENTPGTAEVALVNVDKCVGCGICVGSCDSSSISQASMPVLDVRKFISELEEDVRHVAFVCAESAGAQFSIDENGSCPTLPGYRIVPVPCVGWVHMLTIERALRRGAQGVLVAGCGVDPGCRTGADYTESRLKGDREPWLRTDHVDPEKVVYVRYDRTNPKALVAAAAAFKAGQSVVRAKKARSKWNSAVVAVIVGCSIIVSTVFLSDGPYWAVKREHAEFIVSLKHAGMVVTSSTTDAQVDDSNVLPHMRRARPIERIRVPVQLRVSIDDSVHLSQAFTPGGLFDDGLSIGIAATTVSEGSHVVQVDINNSADPETWSHVWTERLTFKPLQRKVLLFDEDGRFMLYQQNEGL
jgi:ferredoxin/coenzyme F420-reducing hydrogenase delta subunit